MQGRAFSVVRAAASTTTAITIIQIKVPATSMIELTRAWVSQGASATSAQTRVQIVRKTAAATVTAQDPVKLDPNSGASLCVSGTSATGVNASGEGTDGDVLYEDGFNILNGWLWVPAEDDRIVVSPSGIIGLKFPTAPSATFAAGITFLEY